MAGKGKPFANGHRIRAGSKNPNAGRPPDWLKSKCQDLIDKNDLVGFLSNVASGEDMEQVVTDAGEAIRCPASIRDRLRAAEMLLDRGFGKADSKMDLAVTANGPVVIRWDK